MTVEGRIRPKDRDALLQSLRAGVVPRTGLQHIQVGRKREVEAVVKDIDRIADGGSAVRFIIGDYGAGKTFFLSLMRTVALEKRLVTVHADLSPTRRLQAGDGQARALYAELMQHMATRAKPDGGALPSVVEKFISSALTEAKQRGVRPATVIEERLAELSEMRSGYDFAEVINAYWRGYDDANDALKSDAIRWLRGEFVNKPDAKRALNVRTIIDDTGFYDGLKLMARFVRLSGYAGLLVELDEMVNLYKITNPVTRQANYERLLTIVNDSLQGTSVGCGFLFGGTPEFLTDTRRGLYSYPALTSRLAENRFAVGELVDYSGPVLRLAALDLEDFYVLLRNIRHIYAGGDPACYLLPEDALKAFMAHCDARLGAEFFRTPRTTITAFIDLLALLEQYPGSDWRAVIAKTEIAPDTDPNRIVTDLNDDPAVSAVSPPASVRRSDEDDELATFRL